MNKWFVLIISVLYNAPFEVTCNLLPKLLFNNKRKAVRQLEACEQNLFEQNKPRYGDDINALKVVRVKAVVHKAFQVDLQIHPGTFDDVGNRYSRMMVQPGDVVEGVTVRFETSKGESSPDAIFGGEVDTQLKVALVHHLALHHQIRKGEPE